MEQEIIEKKNKERSLKYSIFEGSFYSLTVGFGESYFPAFAIFQKATDTQLGLLTSIPQLFGSIFQLASNKLIEIYKSRKKIITIAALIQALILIPLMLTVFIKTNSILYLILFTAVYKAAAMIISPLWSSWMGDLVESEKRGDYFGRRNKITGAIAFIALIAGGLILNLFENNSFKSYTGFIIVFLFAFIGRIVSFAFLTKKYEPIYLEREEDKFTLVQFLNRIFKGNYGVFVVFLSLMYLAVNISAPYFTAYIFKELNFSYLQYMIITAISVVVKFIVMPMWGRYSDLYGNKKSLVLCSFLLAVIPLLWLISKDFYYIMLIQAYSGFVWAGFELASFNFVFDSTTPQKRVRCLAYYTLINGIGILIGTTMGSLLINNSQLFAAIIKSKYMFVFAVSGVLRLLIAAIFMLKIREMRNVQEISYKDLLLKISGMEQPTAGISNMLIIIEDKIEDGFDHLGSKIKDMGYKIDGIIKKDKPKKKYQV